MGRLDELSPEERAVVEPEGGGIDVHAAMAFLFAALSGSFPHPPPGPVSSDPGFLGGGTANMKGLYAVCHYIYAALSRTALAGALSVARARLLAFLRKLPHGLGEPTTATHGQIWCALISMAIWAAWKVGDQEILDAAIAWKAAEYALWKPCRVGGLVADYWLPGSRAKDAKGLTGSNFARTLEGEILRTYEQASERRNWRLPPQNKSYVGPLALLALPGSILDRIVVKAPKMPPLYRAFHVRRWGADFLAWYEAGLPVMGQGDEPTHIAGSLDGVKWIEGPGGLEAVGKHLGRYPSTEPDVILDVEGA